MRSALLFLGIAAGVMILCLNEVANGQNLDSLLAFKLEEPRDSFYVNHRPLWFVRTKPPLAYSQTVSHEFRLWNPAGDIRQMAHQGFDTVSFFRPAMYEEGAYRWDYAVHPGELVIIPNPNARWSLNGPRFLIYDITPPFITHGHISHGLGFSSPSEIFLNVEVSEMLDPPLSKTEVVFQDDTLRSGFRVDAPGTLSYTSSVDLLPFRADGILSVSLAYYVVDRATNSSDTLGYSGIMKWLEQPLDIEISDASGLLRVKLFRPVAPQGTVVVVLTPLSQSPTAPQQPPADDRLMESIPQGTFVLRPHQSTIANLTPPPQRGGTIVSGMKTLLIDASSVFTVLPERFGSENRHYLSIAYDTAQVRSAVIAAGIPAENYDQRFVGVYRYEHSIQLWTFVGGEGSAGTVEFWPTRFGTLKAAYNPHHDLYPTQSSLHQNYPNPFNASTTIKFEVTEITNVEIQVYDVLGRRITTLVNEVKEPGTYSVKWDAGIGSSGVYLYRLVTEKHTQVRKMLLVK